MTEDEEVLTAEEWLQRSKHHEAGHPAADDEKERPPILQHFAYAHLPEKLRNVSKPFAAMALTIVDTLPENAERSTALRKLLEAKDAAVRAMLEV